MKFKLLILLIGFNLFIFAQDETEFCVNGYDSVFIKQPPFFLSIIDTLNPEREFYTAPFIFGGLNPHYPISRSTEDDNGIYSNIIKSYRWNYEGGTITNYLVEINDSIIEINSNEKFIKIFAPVEDKEEAISFAMALGLKYDFFWSYQERPVPIYVKECEDGYELIIESYFSNDYKDFFNTSKVHVSRNGAVKIIDKKWKEINYMIQ